MKFGSFDRSILLVCGCFLSMCQVNEPRCSMHDSHKSVPAATWTHPMLLTATVTSSLGGLFRCQILRGGSDGGSSRKRGRKVSSGAQSFRRSNEQSHAGGDPHRRQQGTQGQDRIRKAPPESDSESSEETPVPTTPNASACHFESSLKT